LSRGTAGRLPAKRAGAWLLAAWALLIPAAAVAAPGPSPGGPPPAAPPAQAAGGAGGPAAAMPWSGPAADGEMVVVVRNASRLYVFDRFQLANPHDAPLPGLELPLFPGAADVRAVGGEPVAVRPGDRAAVAVPVAPHGHAEVTLTYNLPADRLPVRLQRPVTMPTASLLVMAPEDQLQLRGVGLADLGTTSLQGLALHQYGAQGLAPGTSLALMAEPPLTWFGRLDRAVTPGVWTAVSALALAALLAYGWRREVTAA
jgi:hypothetical protein